LATAVDYWQAGYRFFTKYSFSIQARFAFSYGLIRTAQANNAAVKRKPRFD
jgi:hypothetical protein